MAKILSVDLLKIPKFIHVGDDVNDLTVVTKIRFHPLDIKLEMEYCLHVFIYDIHGEVDAPLVIPNWDSSTVMSLSMDRKDDFLGKKTVIMTAESKEKTIETPIALTLGNFNKQKSYTTRNLEVFATLTPVIGRASKWSKRFTSNISY